MKFGEWLHQDKGRLSYWQWPPKWHCIMPYIIVLGVTWVCVHDLTWHQN